MNRSLQDPLNAYLNKRAIIKPLWERFDHSHCYRRAVVIPALAEAQSLPATLQSLEASAPAGILDDTLIVIVVNNRSPESCLPGSEIYSRLIADIDNNRRTLLWLERQDGAISSHLAWIDAASPGLELPPRSGVGLARKIGCDSVLAWLMESKSGTPLQEFVFFSLDADTLVSPDYLGVAESELITSGKSGGVIAFKHQQADSPESQAAIDGYEAFLHDYVQGLRRAGSPYAFHTVGSCICFTATGYIRAGGFQARLQAGEDFYFCVELIKTGGLCEINNTKVFPSARISRRVPFGTGRHMMETLVEGKNKPLLYDLRVYIALGVLLSAVSSNLDKGTEHIYACIDHSFTKDFLEERHFSQVWPRFQKQYRTKEALLSAFHRWFDGFVTLKYVHRLTEQAWPRQLFEKSR
jgi:hypothetical protein